MPTGYTAALTEKNQTFPEFALLCARNFGALIVMREDPMDAPIPDKFEPSKYHQDRIEQATKELARLRAMSDQEKIAYGEAKKYEKYKRHTEWLKKDRKTNEVYEAMEREVEAWTPPTPDHQGLKDFMLQQLSVSKQDTGYIENLIKESEAKSPMSYYEDAVRSAKRDIDWNTKENAEEIKRANNRTAWIQALKASLSEKRNGSHA